MVTVYCPADSQDLINSKEVQDYLLKLQMEDKLNSLGIFVE